MIENGKRIVLSSSIEICTWFSSCKHTNIFSGWNILLLACLVIHRNFIYTHVFCCIVIMFKNPELLKKRLNAKEQQTEQDLVVKLSGLMFVLGFVIAGLNFRFKWITLPEWVSWLATVIFLFSYLLYAEGLRENTYLSRTVEIQQDQKVIGTGLYGIVRHPMYSATIIMFLSMPLVLGSILSFIIFLGYPLIVAKRIRNEEILLEKELEGYIEYKKKVRYRIIPFVW